MADSLQGNNSTREKNFFSRIDDIDKFQSADCLLMTSYNTLKSCAGSFIQTHNRFHYVSSFVFVTRI